MVWNNHGGGLEILTGGSEVKRSFTVSLIIPTLNEEDNLPLVLPYIPFAWVDEVILVDGRSKDNTVEIARQILPSIRVVLEETPGKGAAMRAGYAAAKGDILIVMDADGSNDPREIPRFIQPLLEGADFVKGSRFAPKGGTTDMPRIRKLGNFAFVQIVNLLFSTKFTDLCYGFHAFWRHSLEQIDLDGIDGFEIDTALYLRSVRSRLKIVDVPSFEGYRFHGDGKLQTIPDGWRVLKTIFREWLLSLTSGKQEEYKGFRSPAQSHQAAVLASRANRVNNPVQEIHGVNQLLLRLVQRSLEDIEESHSYEILLPYILILAVKSLRASSGSILLFDESGEMQESYTVYRGQVQSLRPHHVADTVDAGLAGWILENQQLAVVDNTLQDPRWLPRDWELASGQPRAVLGVPLLDEKRILGVLTLAREGGSFTDKDLGILDEIQQDFRFSKGNSSDGSATGEEKGQWSASSRDERISFGGWQGKKSDGSIGNRVRVYP